MTNNDDSMCSELTDLGERCRRIVQTDGLCPYHSRTTRHTNVMDPLELIDWSSSVEAISAMARTQTRPGFPPTCAMHRAVDEAQTSSAGEPAQPGTAEPRARHLRAVPQPDREHGSGWVFEPPDVLGLDRQRSLHRQAMPGISEERLERSVELYRHHLSPTTVQAYQQILLPFFEYAATEGFNPLTCDPLRIKGYVLDKMMSGKLDASGNPNPDTPYSLSYFKTLLAALRCATAAKGLPDHTASINIGKTIRGYARLNGSKLPRNAKAEIRPDELVNIERTAREGCTYSTALLRAAIAVGCDPYLDLTVAELCALTFKDVTLTDAMAVIAAHRSAISAIEITERPQDPACAVAALRGLREAVRMRIRADSGGTTPTEAQLQARPVFANQNSGEPLSRKGLRLIVNKACATVSGVPPAARGKLPALNPQQRRQAIETGDDPKTIRGLAMMFHVAFCSARAGNARDFEVEHFEIEGRDIDGSRLTTPLVDKIEPDGTVIKGILGRIGTITLTDILDHDGNSLFESRLIMGVHNTFAFGTKTQPFHENWHPAQPGWAACPVRLLLKWLQIYDQILVAAHGTRLHGSHPLFTSLKHPGEPIKQLPRILGEIVKEAMLSIGVPPGEYSAHSLRKFRASYVLSSGGSMTDVMRHDGRSSEVEGLVYARLDRRNPLKADPTRGIYEHTTQQEPATMSATPAPDAPVASAPSAPDASAAAPPPPARQPAPPPESALPLKEAISLLRLTVQQLRESGLDDKAIASIAELEIT